MVLVPWNQKPKPIVRGKNAPIKIGRNQKIQIKRGDEIKTVKFKKAESLLKDGWELHALAE